MLNVVVALLFSIWAAVIPAGKGQRHEVVAPLQVLGVATGVTVLAAGTAVVVAYGAYALWGQANATVDAFGMVRPPRVVKAAAPASQPAQPAATPAAAPQPVPAVDAPPAGDAPAVDETGNVEPKADAPPPAAP
jgi:hypothetical protein